jgi:hypothetical protein
VVQLPEDFPHTRHEQYVMVLPVELLTDAESATRQWVLHRFRRHARRLILPLVIEAVSRGLTVEEFAKQFVAAFEGSPPAVFER